MKIITRWYLVLTPFAKMFPDTSPLCFRGCGHLRSLFHTWWSCPRIQGFWNKVFQMKRKVTGYPIPQTPQIALLNRQVEHTPKHIPSLLFYMLLGAKSMIAWAWKRPSVSFWATKWKISWITVQEKLGNIHIHVDIINWS